MLGDYWEHRRQLVRPSPHQSKKVIKLPPRHHSWDYQKKKWIACSCNSRRRRHHHHQDYCHQPMEEETSTTAQTLRFHIILYRHSTVRENDCTALSLKRDRCFECWYIVYTKGDGSNRRRHIGNRSDILAVRRYNHEHCDDFIHKEALYHIDSFEPPFDGSEWPCLTFADALHRAFLLSRLPPRVRKGCPSPLLPLQLHGLSHVRFHFWRFSSLQEQSYAWGTSVARPNLKSLVSFVD